MPKCSSERTCARRDEIINACAQLYETMNFKDVTLKDVSAQTSFTRTLIYYYFHTKEEIFLALMQREYEAWTRELYDLRAAHEHMSAEAFAQELSRLLEKRSRLLKLLSMNLYDIEANSRMENLIAFKRAYGDSLRAVSACLEKFFPRMTDADISGFIYAFFPFMFGIYPYTMVTDKQREAMIGAQVDFKALSISEMARPLIEKLLAGCQ